MLNCTPDVTGNPNSDVFKELESQFIGPTQLQRTVAPSGSDLTEYHLRCTRCIRLIDATARQGPNMLHDLQVRSAKHLLIDLHEIQSRDDKYSHYGVAAKH